MRDIIYWLRTKKLSTKQNIYIKTQTMTHYSEILEHYRKNKNKKFKSV